MELRNFWPWLKAEFRWRVLGKRYEVVLTEEAQRQLDDLPEEVQEEIRKAMERLSRNPYSGERLDLDVFDGMWPRDQPIPIEDVEDEGSTDKEEK